PAVGWCRRPGCADGVRDAARSDIADRDHPVDWHRQEERDHDGRLRARCGKATRPIPGGSDPPGLPAALPPDHDDDDGGAPRRSAARDRDRYRLGIAPAARRRDRRWADPEPVPDALYNTGHLSCLFVAAAALSAPADDSRIG